MARKSERFKFSASSIDNLQLHQRENNCRRGVAYREILVCLIAIMLAACNQATNPPRKAPVIPQNTAQSAIDIEHEEALKRIWPYEDPNLQAYVEEVGYTILDVTPLERSEVRFTVVDSEIVNAFALPEGNIYITRGLLAYLNSEAELAAILGHEISHLVERHGEKIRDDLYRLPYLDKYLPGLDSPHLSKLGKVSSENLLAEYNQQQELEADKKAAEYLYLAGYSTDAMFRVIATLFAYDWFETSLYDLDADKNYSEIQFHTHPDYEVRLEYALTVYENLPESNGAIKPVRYFEEIDGLLWGQNPARGSMFDELFVHTGFNITFSFPENWSAQNSPYYLIAQSDDNLAELAMAVFELQEHASPKEILLSLAVQDVELIAENFNNQFRSAYGRANFDFSGAEPEPGYIFVISDRNIAFLFFATDGGLNKHFNEILAMLSDFRALSKSEIELVQPLELLFDNVSGKLSWDELAGETPIPYSSLQLQLINASTAKREPTPKGYVKLIRKRESQ